MSKKTTNDDYVYVKLSKILIEELKSQCCQDGYQTLQNCLEDILINKIISDKYND
jgi:hypothetical protein